MSVNKSVLYNTTNEYPSTPQTISTSNNEIRISYRGIRYMKLYYHSNLDTLPIGCGGELRSLSGLFSNPNYNNRNYSDCTWQLIVPAGTQLSFNFRRKLGSLYSSYVVLKILFFYCLELDMGPLTNCGLDNIKFYEVLPDNTEILRHSFCGQTVPAQFNMGVNRLKIVAKKSPNFDGTGFQLHYDLQYI